MARISGKGCLDIAPTLLYCTGLPVPEYMQARVATYVFEQNFLKTRPITYSKTVLLLDDGRADITEEEHRKIADHLRDLGYL